MPRHTSQEISPDSLLTTTYDFDTDSEDLTLKLAEGLGEVLGKDIDQLQPIGYSINIDSINRAFRESPSNSQNLTVSFIHEGAYVEISDDGTITFTTDI